MRTIFICLFAVFVCGCANTVQVQLFSTTVGRLADDLDSFYSEVQSSREEIEIDSGIQSHVRISAILKQAHTFQKEVEQRHIAVLALRRYAIALNNLATGVANDTGAVLEVQQAIKSGTPAADAIDKMTAALINADKAALLHKKITVTDSAVAGLLNVIQSDIQLEVKRASVERVVRDTILSDWYSKAEARVDSAILLRQEIDAQQRDDNLDKMLPKLQKAVDACLAAHHELTQSMPDATVIRKFASYSLE